MKGGLDLDVDDLQPAKQATEYAESRFWLSDLMPLVEHHTPDGSASYVAAHDESAIWGVPGTPQIVAVKVSRDLDRRTFTIQSAEHATIPFAHAWLTEQGCPPEAAAPADADPMAPADSLTAHIAQRIRTSGARYEVLDSYSDPDLCETWTLARDAQAAQAPVRVFVEQGDFATHMYTLREGAFTDVSAARSWLSTRDTPLPQPPEQHGEGGDRRVRAALSRSTGTAALPAGPEVAHQAPAASTVPSSLPRRSI
ncbi:glycosyl hydrolase [Streptomyces sp. NBC_01335]|uniref:glycosyl hydrolase n=1 Tax=Streptomyces sp. NBC_01335 TaxID=2903828 RepID=UPI002E11FF0C|nr:glycosyl hydrolase [Streptomyces sp. NBC_01335]